MPDVSVVIAVKNESSFIKPAIISILTQRGIDHEVIVVEDHSDDDTLTQLNELRSTHPELRLMVNQGRGKCAAFNQGVRNASGRFVCLFAGDDLMPVDSLRARFDRIASESDDLAVVGLCKIMTMSEIKRFDGHLVPKKPGRSALSGVSPLMNRQALQMIFPVPEELPNEDTWMELAVLHMPGWKIIHSDIVGCHWRVHAGNSINMLVGFEEYNRKITLRMRALALFLDRHGAELSANELAALTGKASCEAARVKGDAIGVLTSPIPWIDRLRALSITNAFWYGIRRRLYGLLSGW